jgi:hypothetical protein
VGDREERLRRKGQIKGRDEGKFNEVSVEGGFLHLLGVLKRATFMTCSKAECKSPSDLTVHASDCPSGDSPGRCCVLSCTDDWDGRGCGALPPWS